MNTTRFIRLALGAQLAAVLVLLGQLCPGYAQDLDIKAAIDANHAAIRSLNLDTIAALWSHESDITLVNPSDTAAAVGWDAVKSDWEHSLGGLASLEITPTAEPRIAAAGPVAWSLGTVHVVLHFKSQAQRELDYLEVDVFTNKNGRWLIASHTAKPL